MPRERPTFSQSWSRVSHLTPILRPHITIRRQLYRGEAWHVAQDPISNQFFRLNPVAYHFVGLLDGRRTVDQVWRLTLDRFGDAAPTQNEVIGLLGQLNQSNLLRVDLPADAEQLLKRNRDRTVKHWGGQAMSILFVRFPLFNPDRMLEWALPLARPLLNRWAAILWVVWMAYCAWVFVPHLEAFWSERTDVLAPRNWGWMVVLFVVTKFCHEMGHGLMCKRFGGAVPQFGIMLLVLFPAPFVDATSSWSFPERWKRMLVSAAGMLFELPLAGLAAIIWVTADEGLVRQLAYNTVFIASIATILFNANPLLRFDGYYMLADALQIPNLYERSGRFLRHLIKKFAYGMVNDASPTSAPGEAVHLAWYGVASQIYRLLVLFGIILFISGQMAGAGILLAIWSIIAWGFVPLGKFIHWLSTNPQVGEHRPRAVAVTLGLVAVLLLGLGVAPAPEHRRTEGVVESAEQAQIAVQADGFVTRVEVETGHRVRQGQVLLVARNLDLEARERELNGRIRELDVVLRAAREDDIVEADLARAEQRFAQEELADVRRRISDLTLRSPADGVVVGGRMAQLEGRFLRRGEVIARVINLDDVRITALIDQTTSDAMFQPEGLGVRMDQVEMRSVGRLDVAPIPTRIIRHFPSGRRDLPHPALSYEGGGAIAMDREESDRLRQEVTLHPYFEVWFELPRDPEAPQRLAAYPGQRVYVRMRLPDRPLLAQWIHRLRQVIREQVDL